MFPKPQHPPLVKICGLARTEDMLLAADLGADFLGVILTKRSQRYIPVEAVAPQMSTVRSRIRHEPKFVGVFTDESPEEIKRAYEDLELFAVQIHSHGKIPRLDIPKDRIIPALTMQEVESGLLDSELKDFKTILIDSAVDGKSGGTGKTFDHRRAQKYFEQRRVFLAGGINPHNISELVRSLGNGPFPYAYDLSSGVESSPGIKDARKLRVFFESYAGSFTQP